VNAEAIKALGSVWGSQGGLLSVAELRLLMQLARAFPGRAPHVLEVGHYMGLSTCGLVHALRERGDDWRLTTVDAHCRDAWVPATDPAVFERNRADHFADERLEVVIGLSQELTAPLPFDVVFYDGDHAEEQRRFTSAVIESQRVRLFVFDDRDFAVPVECCADLRAAGWRDESPALQRLQRDKRNPGTMTLGVFRNESVA
jgi:predicted O-methyltransferase YrrM